MLRVIVSCPQIIQSAFCICILAVVSERIVCSLILNTNVFKAPPFIFHFCAHLLLCRILPYFSPFFNLFLPFSQKKKRPKPLLSQICLIFSYFSMYTVCNNSSHSTFAPNASDTALSGTRVRSPSIRAAVSNSISSPFFSI